MVPFTPRRAPATMSFADARTPPRWTRRDRRRDRRGRRAAGRASRGVGGEIGIRGGADVSKLAMVVAHFPRARVCGGWGGGRWRGSAPRRGNNLRSARIELAFATEARGRSRGPGPERRLAETVHGRPLGERVARCVPLAAVSLEFCGRTRTPTQMDSRAPALSASVTPQLARGIHPRDTSPRRGVSIARDVDRASVRP